MARNRSRERTPPEVAFLREALVPPPRSEPAEMTQIRDLVDAVGDPSAIFENGTAAR